MLARMLRLTIALQLLAGAASGFWLCRHLPHARPLLGMVAVALVLPLCSAVLLVVYSCLVSRPHESAALWWRALVGESLAGIRVFLLRQPWAFATPQVQPALGDTVRLPVLLVHGYVCNERLWDELIPALRAQGHTVLAINLEPVFASIDGYAPLLEQAVQTLRQQTGQDQVALVGHSMGGLAIRAWMRHYGSAQAARIITLGTPHVGTRINIWVPTPNGRQMQWHSDWLQALAASETDAQRSLFRIGLSAQDNIVFPQRAQTLAGVTPTVFEGMGHLQLCRSQKVREWICRELALR